ncbi:Hypothetical predicted protein, partial [Scomber scombrus]
MASGQDCDEDAMHSYQTCSAILGALHACRVNGNGQTKFPAIIDSQIMDVLVKFRNQLIVSEIRALQTATTAN